MKYEAEGRVSAAYLSNVPPLNKQRVQWHASTLHSRFSSACMRLYSSYRRAPFLSPFFHPTPGHLFIPSPMSSAIPYYTCIFQYGYLTRCVGQCPAAGADASGIQPLALRRTLPQNGNTPLDGSDPR